MNNFITKFRNQRAEKTTTTTVSINNGDVADVVPADFPPPRDLTADTVEVTRRIEQFASRGSIDLATGGHIVDDLLTAWHNDQIETLRGAWRPRHAAAERLVGAAEGVAKRERERLRFLQEHSAGAQQMVDQAQSEMLGVVDDGPGEPAITPSHVNTCPPPSGPLQVPWQSEPVKDRS